MTTLRIAGFFADLPYGDPAAPRLADTRTDTAAPYEREAVAFLRGGATLLVSPSVSFDVLDPETPIGTLAIQTDGTWAWPADLAHYLERYHCSLAPAFVEHMRACGWHARPDVELAGLEPPAHLALVPVDDAELTA